MFNTLKKKNKKKNGMNMIRRKMENIKKTQIGLTETKNYNT